MTKRNLKILKYYIISVICIVGYFFLEHSNIIPQLVECANKNRYKGFATFFITGLFKYGLLFVGISTILILSFLLIKEKIKKKNKSKTLHL